MLRSVSLVLVWLTLAVFADITAQNEQPINGGILNSKAKVIPRLKNPEELRDQKAFGIAFVEVLIDEEGNVINAKTAVGPFFGADRDMKIEAPHPMLQEAANLVAMEAKFAPVQINGVPVRVSGILVFNFSVPPSVVGPDGRPLSNIARNAIRMPRPAYPVGARTLRAQGPVSVEVTVDELGNVISARAISGHPLLRGAAVEAAKDAKFKPTVKDGNPVKVTGVVTYNFVAPGR